MHYIGAGPNYPFTGIYPVGKGASGKHVSSYYERPCPLLIFGFTKEILCGSQNLCHWYEFVAQNLFFVLKNELGTKYGFVVIETSDVNNGARANPIKAIRGGICK